jgi:hypothetical protein
MCPAMEAGETHHRSLPAQPIDDPDRACAAPQLPATAPERRQHRSDSPALSTNMRQRLKTRVPPTTEERSLPPDLDAKRPAVPEDRRPSTGRSTAHVATLAVIHTVVETRGHRLGMPSRASLRTSRKPLACEGWRPTAAYYHTGFARRRRGEHRRMGVEMRTLGISPTRVAMLLI